MIRQLGENERPNGTYVLTVEVTEGADKHVVYEVHCDPCGDAVTEQTRRLQIGNSNIGQFDHEAEAIEFADGHSPCPNEDL